ncbi:hypothetical protein GCM10007857_63620 [Bradyrhizobium iriomotense]|uniref:Uncharacterized protein n=1 Tax=Bradyrhizobium iriomotense TaxID=441950 RepID=A0ABQ6BBT8_9BRAD|nr:hypothetical protein GCM10007857_63620 [Bradyrhizobium iriomotense]
MICIQAFPAMKIAPTHAKASHQNGDGTLICDNASVTWKPAIPAGIAKTAPITPRTVLSRVMEWAN